MRGGGSQSTCMAVGEAVAYTYTCFEIISVHSASIFITSGRAIHYKDVDIVHQWQGGTLEIHYSMVDCGKLHLFMPSSTESS